MRSLTQHTLTKALMLASMFALSFLFAHAQETQSTSSPTTASTSASNQTTQNQFTGNDTTIPGTGQGYPADKQKRLTDLAANISNKIDATTARLTSIAARMDLRANKLDAQKIDMTDVRFYLGKARESIISVQNDMRVIDSRVAATATSERPFTDWTNIRDTFIDSKSRLESAKKLMQESIDQMNFRIQQDAATKNIGTTTSATNSPNN